jgi:sulfonate transport system permease protein
VLVIVWELATLAHWVDVRIVPPPSAVVVEAARWIADGSLFIGLAASLGRGLAGWLLGGLVGVALGVLVGGSRWAERLVGPSLHTLKHISLFAWLPLLSTAFGREDLAKVVFVAMAAVFPAALGAIEGVSAIARSQVEVARVFGLRRWQTLCRLVLPAASPQILGGLQLALIYAWLATVGGEYLLRSSNDIGLGATVIRGQAAFRVELIVFGMLVIGGVGALLTHLGQRIERRLLRWRGRRSFD